MAQLHEREAGTSIPPDAVERRAVDGRGEQEALVLGNHRGEEETEALVHVAQLYYQLHLTQQQIADRLRTSRSRVSRMLSRAESAGIVEISVHDPFAATESLAQRLSERFGLQRAVVVPCYTTDAAEVNRLLGTEAARLLHELLRPGAHLGVGRGLSVYWTVNSLRPEPLAATVVALCGGMGEADAQFQVNGMVQTAASTLGGRSVYLYAPATVPSADLKAAFLSGREAQDVLSAWSHLDVALIGVGVLNPPYNPAYTKAVQEWLGDDPAFDRVVGDIGLWFYDQEGKVLLPREDVLVSISVEQLRTAGCVVAVAGNVFKARAILGALRGGLINALVTDQLTAERVLHLSEVHVAEG